MKYNIDDEIRDLIHYEIGECKDLGLDKKSPALLNAVTGLYVAYKQNSGINSANSKELNDTIKNALNKSCEGLSNRLSY